MHREETRCSTFMYACWPLASYLGTTATGQGRIRRVAQHLIDRSMNNDEYTDKIRGSVHARATHTECFAGRS